MIHQGQVNHSLVSIIRELIKNFNFKPKFRPRIFDLQYYEAETSKAMRAAADGPRRLKFGMGPQGGSLQQICVRQGRAGIFEK